MNAIKFTYLMWDALLTQNSRTSLLAKEVQPYTMVNKVNFFSFHDPDINQTYNRGLENLINSSSDGAYLCQCHVW